MCGIVGFIPRAHVDVVESRCAFDRLFRESTVRGLHAFGIASLSNRGLSVQRFFDPGGPAKAFDPTVPTIAHARYSTSGDWRDEGNNQPIVVGRSALVFNGVISMGLKSEFEESFGVRCDSDNDGEVFLRRLDAGDSASRFLIDLRGSFSGLWIRDGLVMAATNGHRPLWRCEESGGVWYASTRDIFRRASFAAEPEPVTPLTVEAHECLTA